MQQMTFPTIAEAFFLLPMTILSLFACVPITLKVLNKNREPSNQQTLMIAVFGVLLSTAAVFLQSRGISQTVFSGALVFDRMATYSNYGVLVITVFTLFLSISGVNTRGQSF